MTKAKFGLLSYTNTHNLGDEIQSIAARQFLPQVDYSVDRENLSNFRPNEDDVVGLVMNGWYSHHPENWPPSESIYPLLIAVHISQEPSFKSGLRPTDIMLKNPALKFLHAFSPVGARDLQTYKLLQDSGVDSYFSGCMTLTLNRPEVPKNDELIILNDTSKDVEVFIQNNTKKSVTITEHTYIPNGIAERFSRAEALLRQYASASCVITSRLHCALPCLAMGTPVLLLNTQHDQYRFSGLNEFYHNGSAHDFIAGKLNYDFNSPPPNPESHLPYRNNLVERVTQFVEKVQNLKIRPKYPLSAREQNQILRSNQSFLMQMLLEQKEKMATFECVLKAMKN